MPGTREFLIARGDAAKMFGLVEEPLHLLTQLVLLPVMGKPLGAVRPGGNHGFNAPVCRLCGVGIAGLVHDHRSRFGAVFQLRPQQLEAPGVMLLPYLRFFRAYLSMSDNDNAGTTPRGCPSSGQARGPVPTDSGVLDVLQDRFSPRPVYS